MYFYTSSKETLIVEITKFLNLLIALMRHADEGLGRQMKEAKKYKFHLDYGHMCSALN